MKNKEVACTEKRCFDKKIESERAVIHRNEMRHNILQRNKKEMLHTEIICFDKKTENI
jgi:hypothetical protein